MYFEECYSIADAKSSPLLHKEKNSNIYQVKDIPKLMDSNPNYLFHLAKREEFLDWRGNFKEVLHDMPDISKYCLWKISIDTIIKGYIEVKTSSRLDVEWDRINIIKSSSLYCEPIPIPIKKQWNVYQLSKYIPIEFQSQFPKPSVTIKGKTVTDSEDEIMAENDSDDDDDADDGNFQEEKEDIAATIAKVVQDNKLSATFDLFQKLTLNTKEILEQLQKDKDIPFESYPKKPQSNIYFLVVINFYREIKKEFFT